MLCFFPFCFLLSQLFILFFFSLSSNIIDTFFLVLHFFSIYNFSHFKINGCHSSMLLTFSSFVSLTVIYVPSHLPFLLRLFILMNAYPHCPSFSPSSFSYFLYILSYLFFLLSSFHFCFSL